MLYPIVPHICEELSENLNLIDSNKGHIWPKVDENYINDDKVLIVVQINGKVRKKVEFSRGLSQKHIEEHILCLDDIIKYTNNKTIKKIIYIKEKLVNIVIQWIC